MVSSLASKLCDAAPAAGITKSQRQFVAMMGAQAEAVDADGVKYTLFADGNLKATIIRRYGAKIMKETAREVEKENDVDEQVNKVNDTKKGTIQGATTFDFKSNVKKKEAAPPKAKEQAAPAASKAQAAPEQPKPKPKLTHLHPPPPPRLPTPKVDKNALSAQTDGAGARRKAVRSRSASPESNGNSDRSSSGSAEPFAAMDTSFPPLSLPAKKEPRGPLPGQSLTPKCVELSGWDRCALEDARVELALEALMQEDIERTRRKREEEAEEEARERKRKREIAAAARRKLCDSD